MAKKAKVADVSVKETSVTWDFGSGRMVEVDLAELSDAIAQQAALHGIKQKGSDSYASAGKAGPEAGMTPRAWAFEQCRDVIECLVSGEWTRKREGSGGLQITDLVAALAELRPEVDEAGWKARIEAMDKTKVDLIKKAPEVDAIIQRRRAERAAARAKATEEAAEAASTDLESLLA